MELPRKTIVGSRERPHLLVTGGVHGDEFEPVAAIRRLGRVLDPAELQGTVTLVPVVNGPAFARGSRTAEDGLDLARTCPGRPDGSITEQIAHALSELIRSADRYVDLHSGGVALEILPLVGYMLHEDPTVLDIQRRMARAFNLPVVWGTSAAHDGRSLSVARDARLPAIYAEWGGGGRCNPAGVAAYVEGCLGVMAAEGMLSATEQPLHGRAGVPRASCPCTGETPVAPGRANLSRSRFDRRPRPRVLEHVVEDDRPGSGHLQACYPSPMAGVFEPAVRLGEEVRVGDAIGQVSDALGERSATIESTEGGIVLCLRSLARVSEGDSLAVVLEIDASAPDSPEWASGEC